MQDSLGLTYLSTSLSLPLLASPPPYYSPFSHLHLSVTPPFSSLHLSVNSPFTSLHLSITPPSHISTSLSLPLLTSTPLYQPPPPSHLSTSLSTPPPSHLSVTPPSHLSTSLSLPLLISPPLYHSPFSPLYHSPFSSLHFFITPFLFPSSSHYTWLISSSVFLVIMLFTIHSEIFSSPLLYYTFRTVFQCACRSYSTVSIHQGSPEGTF